MNPNLEIHIEQPSDTASTAFCDLAMANSGRAFSKGAKHARKTTSIDQAVDRYFADTAATENRRVLAHAIENGLIPATDEKGVETSVSALKWNEVYAGKTRQSAYDAIRGMCTADERFRPSIDATVKLGSQIKALITDAKNMEVRVPDVKLFVETYLSEVYLHSEGVSEYLTIDELSPKTAEEQSDLLDNEELAATEDAAVAS